MTQMNLIIIQTHRRKEHTCGGVGWRDELGVWD